MMTSAFLYHVMHLLNITIDIRNVCVFLAPLFSSLTVIVTYHLTKELKVRGVATGGGGGAKPFNVLFSCVGCQCWTCGGRYDCHSTRVHLQVSVLLEVGVAL